MNEISWMKVLAPHPVKKHKRGVPMQILTSLAPYKEKNVRKLCNETLRVLDYFSNTYSLMLYVSCCSRHQFYTYSFCYLFSGTRYFRYVVKKAAAGLTVTKMENKIGLRIVQNGDGVLREVFVPDDDRI